MKRNRLCMSLASVMLAGSVALGTVPSVVLAEDMPVQEEQEAQQITIDSVKDFLKAFLGYDNMEDNDEETMEIPEEDLDDDILDEEFMLFPVVTEENYQQILEGSKVFETLPEEMQQQIIDTVAQAYERNAQRLEELAAQWNELELGQWPEWLPAFTMPEVWSYEELVAKAQEMAESIQNSQNDPAQEETQPEENTENTENTEEPVQEETQEPENSEEVSQQPETSQEPEQTPAQNEGTQTEGETQGGEIQEPAQEQPEAGDEQQPAENPDVQETQEQPEAGTAEDGDEVWEELPEVNVEIIEDDFDNTPVAGLPSAPEDFGVSGVNPLSLPGLNTSVLPAENALLFTPTITEARLDGEASLPTLSSDTAVQSFINKYLTDNGKLISSASDGNYTQILSGLSTWNQLSSSQRTAVNSWLKENSNTTFQALFSQAQTVKANQSVSSGSSSSSSTSTGSSTSSGTSSGTSSSSSAGATGGIGGSTSSSTSSTTGSTSSSTSSTTTSSSSSSAGTTSTSSSVSTAYNPNAAAYMASGLGAILGSILVIKKYFE